MKLKGVKTKALEYLEELRTLNYPLKLNYCIEQNAGDSFNKDFIGDYFGVCVGKNTMLAKKHYLFCGSVLSRSNNNSIVIGAGLISDEVRYKGSARILGVRGELSLKKVRKFQNIDEDIFLGDPGSMIREIALLNDDRSLTNSGKKYKLGIIPHFVDYPYVQRSFYNDPSVLVIDIKNRYDLVAKKIKGCEAIVSSSLHGLIFSDAIGVPNSWVSISDRIVGGDFKFNDYYSVCDLGKIKNTCRDKKSIMNASERSFVSNPLFYFKMKNLVNNEFFKYA